MNKENYKKISLFIFSSVLLVFAVASLLAIDPADLKIEEKEKNEVVKIKMPESKAKEEIEPPPEKPAQESLLSTLAPDSFATPQDLGGGVGFGSGGFGPAVAGGGGFGADGAQMSKEKDNIHRPPRLLIKSALDYPSEARQNSVSGFVLLKILVNTSGSVESVQVEHSEPRGVFDAAATRSIKEWKFEPAIVKGQIVAAWTMQKIKFELN